MRARRTSVTTIRATKAAAGASRLAMMTAYDEPTARLVDAGGVDLILVGDSLGNVVLGHEDTLRVTVDDMVHHTAAVAAARPAALIIGDLPWLSYHVTVEEAIRSAAALIRAGADAVKLEGVPDALGAAITAERSIPTIGIGAGPGTDGQVLVFHDAMGLGADRPPKFVRQYLDGASLITAAVTAYVADVRSGDFPGAAESYASSDDLRSHLDG